MTPDEQAILTKRDRTLKGLDIALSCGMEIGPLNRPLVKRSDSTVYYVDYMSQAELQEKYADHFDTSSLCSIDLIWHGQSYSELLGDKAPLDYIVASHVIEHVPDLIGWLRECHSVLKDEGVLCLVIPDKRFIWDLRRPESVYEDVKSAQGRKRPGMRCVMDHYCHAVSVETHSLWNDYSQMEGALYYSSSEEIEAVAQSYLNGSYIDVHCWTFTPWSFMALMRSICRDAGIGFDLRHFQTTPRYDLEFYVQLEKSPVSSTDWDKATSEARLDALWPDGMPIYSGRPLHPY